MKFSIINSIILIFFISIISVSFFACDDHIFTEFRSTTDFTISEFDAEACYLLSRDTVRVDTVINGPDTTITETKQYLAVTLTYLTDATVDDWENASDSLIAALFDTIEADTTCVVNNPDIQETGYTLYQQRSGRSSTVVFFISWELSGENATAYINIDLINRSGETMTLQTSSMDLETIAGCSQTFESAGGVSTIPSIRSRLTFSLPEDTYLVRCYFTKPEAMENFKMVIF